MSRPPAPPRRAARHARAAMLALPLSALAPTAVPAPPHGAPAPSVARAAQEGAQADRAEVPWSVGERLQYDVRFGKLKVGSGSIQVVGFETVRGREAYRTRFQVTGGTFFFRVNDVLESWIDSRTLASLRFVKDQQEGRRDREVRYEIFPERTTFQEGGGAEQRSVEQPLDDGSFLFFVRTLPLRVGETYELNRYFKPDRNPVRIRVLRRERIKVPAGTFDAIVIQPTFRTKGIFSEDGHAEVWLSDDERRLVLQMKSSLSFGSLNLYLRTLDGGQRSASR